MIKSAPAGAVVLPQDPDPEASPAVHSAVDPVRKAMLPVGVIPEPVTVAE